MQAEPLATENARAVLTDRRRFQRVRLSLLGRFMLENRREYPCQTLDMSPGSCSLVAPVLGALGEHVVAYIDHVGRIDGDIDRLFDGGFAMSIESTSRRKDKLAAKLTWLVNRYILNLAEDRRHERVTPSISVALVTLPDGRKYPCTIVDLSLSGAALAIEYKPLVGSPIRLGGIRCTVVRHVDDGVAVEFAVLQTPNSLEDGLAASAQ